MNGSFLHVFAESTLTFNYDVIMGVKLEWCYLLDRESLMQKVCNVCLCVLMCVYWTLSKKSLVFGPQQQCASDLRFA